MSPTSPLPQGGTGGVRGCIRAHATARKPSALIPSNDDDFAFSPAVREALSAIYAEEELEQLATLLREPPDALHLRVNTLQTSRGEAITALREAVPGFRPEEHPDLDDVLVVRRSPPDWHALAPYVDGMPSGLSRFEARKAAGLPVHELVVDRVCGEAVLRGADIFCRGCAAASFGMRAGDEVSLYVDVHSALLRGSVPDTLDGLRFLGVGTSAMDRSEIFRAKRGLAATVRHTVAGNLPAVSGLLPGSLYVQSLPSLTVSHVLGARPGERILDCCAAPGSKATHTASRFLRGRGELVACERNQKKVEAMRELCKALGLLPTVIPTRADTTHCLLPPDQPSPPPRDEPGAEPAGEAQPAAEPPAETSADAPTSEEPAARPADAAPKAAAEAAAAQGECDAARRRTAKRARNRARRREKQQQRPAEPARAQFVAGSFDRVLLDPPCSALGLRPKLRHDVDGQGAPLDGACLANAAAYQRLFLPHAVALLRPGGTLVYSTCTLTPLENEGFVARALAEHPCLALVPASPRVGGPGRPCCGLSAAACALVQRFEPRDGVEGFFIAKFEKRPAGGAASSSTG